MSPNFRLIFPFDVSNNYTKSTLPLKGTIRHENQAFGSKDFALEPCNKKSSHKRLQNHKVHKLLKPNANFSQKKRKFDSNMNGDKFATTLGFISREKCGNKSAILNEKVECYGLCRQNYYDLSNFDEFSVELNPMKRRHLKALKPLVNEGPGNSSETPYLVCSKNEGMELTQPQNEANHVPRPVIPIGPRFQAKVPKWEGTSNIRYDNHDDDLKWLGVQLWPMPSFSGNKSKVIGEGRHDSCSCEFPGSIDCIKLHISETRELLKLEIGTTFSSWKFDDMGEDVSKSWTLEEQKEFESLVKSNPLSNGKKFWKLAMENFPSKSMKCMINYYHNVYIPRRLSTETRSSYNVADSDNDQDENLNNKNDYSSTGRSLLSNHSRCGV